MRGASLRNLSIAAMLPVALLVFAAVSGCGKSAPPCPSQDRVLRAFAADPPGSSPTDSLGGELQLDLYIDDSKSVAGFVADRAFGYVEVLGSLLRHTETAGYVRRVFRISDMSLPVHGLSRNIVLSSNFYTGGETPLRRLLDAIRQRRDPNRIALVITDLVQSESLDDQQSLAEALRLLALQNPHIVLLGFRSQFRGSYYPQAASVPEYQLSVRGGVRGSGRPYYLLIVAPSRAALEGFRKYVLREIGEEEAFEPSRPSFDITAIEFHPEHQPNRKMWNSNKDPELFPPGDSSPRGYRVAYVQGMPIKPGSAELRLQCALRQGLPLIDLDQIRYRMEKVSFVKERLRAKPVPARGRVEFGDSLAKGLLRVNYVLDVPEPGAWDAYRVQLWPGNGNLGVPAWVDAWSTETDESPARGDRTVHFSQFVEALVRAITERVVASDQYVLIGSSR